MTAVRGWFEHVEIADLGTVWTFRLITDEARQWWADNVGEVEPWRLMGSRICIDHRPARDIAHAIASEWPVAFH